MYYLHVPRINYRCRKLNYELVEHGKSCADNIHIVSMLKREKEKWGSRELGSRSSRWRHVCMSSYESVMHLRYLLSVYTGDQCLLIILRFWSRRTWLVFCSCFKRVFAKSGKYFKKWYYGKGKMMQPLAITIYARLCHVRNTLIHCFGYDIFDALYKTRSEELFARSAVANKIGPWRFLGSYPYIIESTFSC